MDYEATIFPHTGGYGRFNRLVVVFSWFPNFAVMLNLYCEVFYTLIPSSYHCKPDPQLLPSTFLLSNLSREAYFNLTIPWVNGTGLSHCELYKYPPNSSNFSQNLPRERVSCTQGWEYANAAGLQTNFVMEWDLVCSEYWKIPLQHICFMTGWILGYVMLGTLCDRVGRRQCFLLSVGLSTLLGAAVCLSNSALVFMLLRLSQGFMLAGVFLSTFIARLELCDPPHRVMVTMVGGFFGIIAELLLPGLAVLCRAWQVLQAVSTLPILLLIPYFFCRSVFPESPRWLLATGQISQAMRSLKEFSTKNGVCLSGEIYPGETLLSVMHSAYGEDYRSRYYSVLQLRQTHVIWKNCFILSFTLFIGTGIQYCFTRNMHIYSEDFYFNYFLRVITGTLACIFICLSVNHFGRRGMLLLSAIITGISSLLLLALTPYLFTALVFVLSVVGLLFSQSLAMLSAFFASEVMPTVLRGGCLGMVLAAGCAGMAASSLMELQNNRGFFLFQVIFASLSILSIPCIMVLPESKRKPLPDSLKEGESQQRPPLFLPKTDRINLPLLHRRYQLSEYNSDSYSSLVSVTRRMFTTGHPTYTNTTPVNPPPAETETQAQENETLQKLVS
ncbi:putative solute carrier family 22 member 31 [Aulostomus maculatus]